MQKHPGTILKQLNLIINLLHWATMLFLPLVLSLGVMSVTQSVMSVTPFVWKLEVEGENGCYTCKGI